MYDNSLVNLRRCFIGLLLSAFLWLIPSFSHANSFSFRTNQLDVAEGSTYGGQAVQSATLVGLVSAAGLATTALIRVGLADGTFVTISKSIVLNASKAYNLIGLCAANPVACGTIGAGLAVTALVIYLVVENAVPYMPVNNLEAIRNSLGQSSPDVPYNFPPFWSDLSSDTECKNDGVTAYGNHTSVDFIPCWKLDSADYVTGEIVSFILYGNAILGSYFKTWVPDSNSLGLKFFKVNHVNRQMTVVLYTNTKIIDLAPVQPFHAPPIVSTIPLPDRVINPVTNVIPDIYNPVVIDGAEPIQPDNTIPPPPVISSLNPDGSVSTVPINPSAPINPVIIPPSPVTIPIDPTIPVTIDPTVPVPTVPTIPDVTPVETTPTITKPIIRDAIKEAIDDAEKEAEEDAESTTPPDYNHFDIYSYLNWGDSWLPSGCPSDLSLEIQGYPLMISFSPVCEYAPAINAFIRVAALISFVGIVVGGLKS